MKKISDQSMLMLEAGLRQNIKRATIELSIVLGTADIRVADLVNVEAGDVIVLNTRIDDPLEARVNDKVKFRAYPGAMKGKLAAKLILEE